MQVNLNRNNFNFSSRCKSIKMGQKVVHTINSEVPHLRLSLYNDAFSKLFEEKLHYYNREKQLELIPIFNNIINDFLDSRATLDEGLSGVLSALKKNKIGNCWEDNFLAAGILNYMGHKNVYLSSFKKGDELIDHMICVYNKDDSELQDNDMVNNKTIILDAWSGIVDFAGNYFKKIQDKFVAGCLELPAEGLFMLSDVSKVVLDDNLISEFEEKMPLLRSVKSKKT